MKKVELSELIGKQLVKIENSDNEHIDFTTDSGKIYRMYHNQDCCENVSVEDIIGCLDDLTDGPILQAYETSNKGSEIEGSYFEWTFYTIVTQKTTATIRWYGDSNGEYSTSVDFVLLNN